MDQLIPIKSSHPIFEALIDIQKPRTEFQLKNFVVGQHDTEEQQYKQCLMEIQALIHTIKVTAIEIKKNEIKIKKLRATKDEIDELDAQILELNLDQSRLALVGAQRELSDLVAIWESFPHKFTYEEIEESQPEYWYKRLTRQSTLETIGGSQAQSAHLEALRQIGVISVDDTGIHEVKELGYA